MDVPCQGEDQEFGLNTKLCLETVIFSQDFFVAFDGGSCLRQKASGRRGSQGKEIYVFEFTLGDRAGSGSGIVDPPGSDRRLESIFFVDSIPASPHIPPSPLRILARRSAWRHLGRAGMGFWALRYLLILYV